jgi:hypothetical protein
MDLAGTELVSVNCTQHGMMCSEPDMVWTGTIVAYLKARSDIRPN